MAAERPAPKKRIPAPKKPGKKDYRKEIVARAMVDPSFRRKLFASPETVFGAELTAVDRAGLERLRVMFRSFDGIITSLAGEVLCGGGGGCGGLA